MKAEPRANRQWRLARRPSGRLHSAEFVRRVETVPSLAQGEILVRNLWLSCSPQMKEWMEDGAQSSAPPMQVGDVVRCPALAQVQSSRSPLYPEGSIVLGLFGWQDYAVVRSDARWGDDGIPAQAWTGIPRIKPAPVGVEPRMALGALGTNGLAAYFGLLEVARVKPGDRVVVTGAAGATGSIACQIAKLHACWVVGIASSTQKCEALLTKVGTDIAISHLAEDVEGRLRNACPTGFDVVFDTSQGKLLDACLANLAPGARVVLCGAMSALAAGTSQPIHGLMNAVWKKATLRGFSVYEFSAQENQAIEQLTAWHRANHLQVLDEVYEGFDRIPEAFLGVLSGTNIGKRLVHLADPQ